MLVVSRCENESIILKVGEEEIKVMVVAIKGSRVRIGIEAPSTIPVWREELDPRKRKDNEKD